MTDSVLVLGAGGFVGKHLVRALTEAQVEAVSARTLSRALAKHTYDWTPATGMTEGLQRTWQWFSTSQR